jgi:uncharacterized membrane protein SirB2
MSDAGTLLVFYPQIKFVHVLCVVLSGSLFALRGVAMLAGWGLANHAGVRYLSYAIDSTLLTAALMLVTMLHQYPFVQAWLTVKILLLALYIVLGVFALRRGCTRSVRGACLLAALAVFAFIASVAHAHDPRGVLLMIAQQLVV